MVTWGSTSEGSSSKVSRGGGNRYVKSKKKSQSGSRSKKSLVRMIDDKKKELLAEKHAELEEVWNNHDMLVRQYFFPSSFSFLYYNVVSDVLSTCRSEKCSKWRAIL